MFAQAVGCEHLCSMKEDPSSPLASVRDATFSRESLREEPREDPLLHPLWKRAVTAEESTDMAVDELEGLVIAEGVGPLPRTKKGHEYVLTIMDVATQFPEVVPLHDIWASTSGETLLQFGSLVGLPKEVQSDRGTHCKSGVFPKDMCELGVTLVRSSNYHPESQGALERGHLTLSSMVRTFDAECPKDWDVARPFLLWARYDIVDLGGAYVVKLVGAYPALFRDPVLMHIDDGD